LVSIIIIPGCSGERLAKEGDTVKVHYTGRLTDGTEFDSSIGGTPLQFKIGSGQVISGFDQAVTGMKLGESKTVEIPVDEAYGPYDDGLVRVENIDELSLDFELEIGQKLQGYDNNGQLRLYTVTELTESTVTLDANPSFSVQNGSSLEIISLAGKDLIFDIELVEIL